MAEALGAASAIAGLISLSGKLLAQGYAFASTVHHAPRELRELLSEAASLDVVLNQLQSIVDRGTESEPPLPLLTKLSDAGVIVDCQEALMLVKKAISRCEQIHGQQIRNLGKRIVWPFKEKETKDALVRLSRVRDTLSAALTADIAGTLGHLHRLSKDTTSSLSQLKNWTVNQDQHKELEAVRKWLTLDSIDVEGNLREGLQHRHLGTGSWLIRSDLFKIWLSGKPGLFWIHGIPGSGKTVLASAVISNLLGQERDPSKGLVYFFCDHRTANQRTIHGFFTSGLLQLIAQMPELEGQVLKRFRERSTDYEKTIDLKESRLLFNSLVIEFSEVTIIIDALDECNELERFVEELGQLVTLDDIIMRILVTGRPDYALERSLGILATYRIALEQYIGSDIELFVTDQVNTRIQTRKLKVRSSELKDLIIHVLSQHANGMFIWAAFQLDLICRLSNDRAIRQALRKLPRGLENTYLYLLEQIKERNLENLDAVIRALTWLIASSKPMTLGELVEAISIDLEDTCRNIEKMLTDDFDLIDMLGSLVTLHWTQKDPTVTLAHYTLYEFLHSETLQKHHSLSMFFIPQTSWLDCGAICAQYLSFSDFHTPCDDEQDFLHRKTSYRFLRFAATSWNQMLRFYGGRGPATRTLMPQLKWFLTATHSGKGNFASWQQAFHDCVDCSRYPCDPLYYAVGFDMVTMFDLLIEEGANPQFLYQEDYTPLQVAIIARDQERVSTILKTNVQIDARGPSRQTALHIAVSHGNADIVKLLLDAGASPHVRSDAGSTPFYGAARSGSIPTLEILHKAGSDVNAATWDAWTPLFEAMENLQVPAVDWLVRKGAKLDQKILDGLSVLEYAKETQNEAIVTIIENGLAAQRMT